MKLPAASFPLPAPACLAVTARKANVRCWKRTWNLKLEAASWKLEAD
jgi:hypothetical protein